ncbi:MAG TPA: hypothetical protein VMT85_01050 [Thermoanaerobaculia bacterium]|nr:hypothetical protein [Thermoanaerobaculia bacterium]
MLPADNVWNTRVDLLPAHPSSEQWVSAIGADAPLTAAGGADAGGSSRPSISWWEVTRPAPLGEVSFEFVEESDPGPYPMPPEAALQAGAATMTRHILLLDSSRCSLYELYDARAVARGWSASSGAVYDLKSNELRPLGRIAGNRSGLPVFPGLLRIDEVDRGEIHHALGFSAPQIGSVFVWPARRAAPNGASWLPPAGLRFRLRGDLELSGFSARVRAVLTALQRYGMFLAEEGEPWTLSGVEELRWTEAEVAELSEIHGADFVAVDSSLLQVNEDSGRVRIQLEAEPLSVGSNGPFECVPSEEVACIDAGRFDVRVRWVDRDGTSRSARTAATRSDDSALFWFFEPSNWELMVKVIDGCQVNGHHWVFFAGTTDRGFSLEVADGITGDSLLYTSPPGQPAAAVTDSDAFGACPR